tara:strand:+ start:760 stop:1185 length:426 start_codon:yes stop_codon:yes gene_type:complete
MALLVGHTKIVGMDNVIASLKRCSNESRKKKLLRRVLSFGAFPMWKQMKANAPMRTGNLKQSISRISSRRNALVVVGARAGRRAKYDGYYVNWVVKGHKTRGGGQTKAQDFITPAFEQNQELTVKRIEEKLIQLVITKNWR